MSQTSQGFVLPPISRQHASQAKAKTGDVSSVSASYAPADSYGHSARGVGLSASTTNPLAHVHMPAVGSGTQHIQQFQYRYAATGPAGKNAGPIPVNAKTLETGNERGGSQYLERRHNLNLYKPPTQVYAWPVDPHSGQSTGGQYPRASGSVSGGATSHHGGGLMSGAGNNSHSPNAFPGTSNTGGAGIAGSGSLTPGSMDDRAGDASQQPSRNLIASSSSGSALVPAGTSGNGSESSSRSGRFAEACRMLMDFLTNPLRCQFFACDPPLVIGDEEAEAILKSIPVQPEEIMAYLVALNTTGRVFLSINELISALRDAYTLAVHRAANDALLRAVPEADRRQIVEILTSPSCTLFAENAQQVQATGAQLARLILEAGSITHALQLIELFNARGRTFETMDQLIFAVCAARLHEKILERVQTELLHFLQSPQCGFFVGPTTDGGDGESEGANYSSNQPRILISPDDAALIISRAGAGVDTLLHVRALNAAQMKFPSIDALIQAIADAHVDLVRKRKLYFLSDYSFTITDLQRQELLEFFHSTGYRLFVGPSTNEGEASSSSDSTALVPHGSGNDNTSGNSDLAASMQDVGGLKASSNNLLADSDGTHADATSSGGASVNPNHGGYPGVVATTEELDMLLVQGRGLLSCKSHLIALIEGGRTFTSFSQLIAAVEREHLRMRNEILDYLQSNHCSLIDHSITLTTADVDRLLIEGHAGAETLYYLRLFDAQRQRFANVYPDLAQALRRAHVAALNKRIEERIATLTYLYSSECRLLNKDVPTSDRAVRRLFDVGGPATRVLLEALDRAGRRFSSMAALTEAVAQERAAAASAKREVLAYLRSPKCSLFAVPVVDASTSTSSNLATNVTFNTELAATGPGAEFVLQQQAQMQQLQQQQNPNVIVVNAATVDRLIAEGGAGTATLRVLWALEARKDRFCTWSELIEAIRCYQGDALEARRAARQMVRSHLVAPRRQILTEPTRITDTDLDALVAAARSNAAECVLTLKVLEFSGFRARNVPELIAAVREEAIHGSAHRVELTTYLRSSKCRLFETRPSGGVGSRNGADGEVIVGDNTQASNDVETGESAISQSELADMPFNPALATAADIERLYVETGAGKYAIHYLRAMNAAILAARRHGQNQVVIEQRQKEQGIASLPSNPVGLSVSPSIRGKTFTSLAALVEAVSKEHARWTRAQEALAIFFQQQCSLVPSSMPVPISTEALVGYVQALHSSPEEDAQEANVDDKARTETQQSSGSTLACIFTPMGLMEVRNLLPANVSEFLRSTQAGPLIMSILLQFQRDKLVFPSLQALASAIADVTSRADQSYFSSTARLQMRLADRRSALLVPALQKRLTLPDAAAILTAARGDVARAEQILNTLDDQIMAKLQLGKDVGATNAKNSTEPLQFKNIRDLAEAVQRAYLNYENHKNTALRMLTVHLQRLFTQAFIASLTETSARIESELPEESKEGIVIAVTTERQARLSDLASELSDAVPHTIPLQRLFLSLRKSAPFSSWQSFLECAVSTAKRMLDETAAAEIEVLEYLSRPECVLLKPSLCETTDTGIQALSPVYLFDHDVQAFIGAAGGDGAACLAILRIIEDEVHAMIRDSAQGDATDSLKGAVSSQSNDKGRAPAEVSLSAAALRLLKQVSTPQGLAEAIASLTTLSPKKTEEILNYLNYGDGRCLLLVTQGGQSVQSQDSAPAAWFVSPQDLMILQSVVLPAGGPSLKTVLESLVKTVERTGDLPSPPTRPTDAAPIDRLLDAVEDRAHSLAARRARLATAIFRWLAAKPGGNTAGNDIVSVDTTEPESDLRVVPESFLASLTGTIASCAIFKATPKLQRHLTQLQVIAIITDAARPYLDRDYSGSNGQSAFTFTSPSTSASLASHPGSGRLDVPKGVMRDVDTTVALFSSSEAPLGYAAKVFTRAAEAPVISYIDADGIVRDGPSQASARAQPFVNNMVDNQNESGHAVAPNNASLPTVLTDIVDTFNDVDQQLAFEMALFHLRNLNELGFRALSIAHLAEALRRNHQNFIAQAKQIQSTLCDPRCSLFLGTQRPILVTMTDVFDLLSRAYAVSPQVFSTLSPPTDMIVHIHALQAADRRFSSLSECWDELIRSLQRPSERRLAAITQIRKYLLTEATATPVVDITDNSGSDVASPLQATAETTSIKSAGVGSTPLFLPEAHPLVLPETLLYALYDIAQQDAASAIGVLRAVQEESASGFASLYLLVQACANYRLAFTAQAAAVRRILLASVVPVDAPVASPSSGHTLPSAQPQVLPMITGCSPSDLHDGCVASILKEAGVGLAGLACVQQLQRARRTFNLQELVVALSTLAGRVRQEQNAILRFLRSPNCALLARAAPDAAASLGPADVRLLIRQGSACAVASANGVSQANAAPRDSFNSTASAETHASTTTLPPVDVDQPTLDRLREMDSAGVQCASITALADALGRYARKFAAALLHLAAQLNQCAPDIAPGGPGSQWTVADAAAFATRVGAGLHVSALLTRLANEWANTKIARAVVQSLEKDHPVSVKDQIASTESEAVQDPEKSEHPVVSVEFDEEQDSMTMQQAEENVEDLANPFRSEAILIESLKALAKVEQQERTYRIKLEQEQQQAAAQGQTSSSTGVPGAEAPGATALEGDPFHETSTIVSPREPWAAEQEANAAEAAAEATAQGIENLRAFLASSDADPLFGLIQGDGQRPNRPGEFADITLALAEAVYYETGAANESVDLVRTICARNVDLIKRRVELTSRIIALRKELTELKATVMQQADELTRTREQQNSGQDNVFETKGVAQAHADLQLAEEAYTATVRQLALLPLASYVTNRRQLIDLIRKEHRSTSRAGTAALRVKMTEVRERQLDAAMLQPPSPQPTGPQSGADQASPVASLPQLLPSLITQADKLAIAQYLSHPDCGLFAGAGPSGVRLTGTDLVQLLSAARTRQRCLAHLLSLDTQRQVFSSPARLIQAVLKEREQFLQRRRELLLYLWSPACLCLSDRSKAALTAADAETLLLLPRTGGDATALKLVMAVLAELDLIVQSGGEAVVERRAAAIRMLNDETLLADKSGSAVAATALTIASTEHEKSVAPSAVVSVPLLAQAASSPNMGSATVIANAVSAAAASVGVPGEPFANVADLIEVVRRAWPLCARAAKAVEQQQRRAVQRRVAIYQRAAFEAISRYLADPACCLFSRTLQSVVVTDKSLAQLFKASHGLIEVSLAALRELEGSPGPMGFPSSAMFENLPDPQVEPIPLETGSAYRLKPLSPDVTAALYLQKQQQQHAWQSPQSQQSVVPMETLEQARDRRDRYIARSRALVSLVGEGELEELWPATYCDAMDQLIAEVNALVSQFWVSCQADLLAYLKQPSVWALLFGDSSRVLPGGQSRENLNALDIIALWNMGLSGRRTRQRIRSFVRAREVALTSGALDNSFETFSSWGELAGFIRFQEERRLAAAARWRRISLHVRDAVHLARRPQMVAQGRQVIRAALVDASQPIVLFDANMPVYITGAHIAELYESGDVEARARAAEREQREILIGASVPSRQGPRSDAAVTGPSSATNKEDKDVAAAWAAIEALGVSRADCNWAAAGGSGPGSITLFYLHFVESLIHWSRSDSHSSALPANRRFTLLESADELVLAVQALVRLGVVPSPLGPAAYEKAFIRLVPVVVSIVRKRLRELSEGQEQRDLMRRLRLERQQMEVRARAQGQHQQQQQQQQQAGQTTSSSAAPALGVRPTAAEAALVAVPESEVPIPGTDTETDTLGVRLGPNAAGAGADSSANQAGAQVSSPIPSATTVPSTTISIRVSLVNVPQESDFAQAIARGMLVRAAQRAVVSILLSSTSPIGLDTGADGSQGASAFTLTGQQTEVLTRTQSPVFSVPLTLTVPTALLHEGLAALAAGRNPALAGALECKLLLQPYEMHAAQGAVVGTPEAGSVLAESSFSLAELVFAAAAAAAGVRIGHDASGTPIRSTKSVGWSSSPILSLPLARPVHDVVAGATVHIWLAKLHPIPPILRAITKSFQVGEKGAVNADNAGRQEAGADPTPSAPASASAPALAPVPRIVFRASCADLPNASDGTAPCPKIVLLLPTMTPSVNSSAESTTSTFSSSGKGLAWIPADQESEFHRNTTSPSFFTVFALPAPPANLAPPRSCVRVQVMHCVPQPTNRLGSGSPGASGPGILRSELLCFGDVDLRLFNAASSEPVVVPLYAPVPDGSGGFKLEHANARRAILRLHPLQPGQSSLLDIDAATIADRVVESSDASSASFVTASASPDSARFGIAAAMAIPASLLPPISAERANGLKDVVTLIRDHNMLSSKGLAALATAAAAAATGASQATPELEDRLLLAQLLAVCEDSDDRLRRAVKLCVNGDEPIVPADRLLILQRNIYSAALQDAFVAFFCRPNVESSLFEGEVVANDVALAELMRAGGNRLRPTFRALQRILDSRQKFNNMSSLIRAVHETRRKIEDSTLGAAQARVLSAYFEREIRLFALPAHLQPPGSNAANQIVIDTTGLSRLHKACASITVDDTLQMLEYLNRNLYRFRNLEELTECAERVFEAGEHFIPLAYCNQLLKWFTQGDEYTNGVPVILGTTAQSSSAVANRLKPSQLALLIRSAGTVNSLLIMLRAWNKNERRFTGGVSHNETAAFEALLAAIQQETTNYDHAAGALLAWVRGPDFCLLPKVVSSQGDVYVPNLNTTRDVFLLAERSNAGSQIFVYMKQLQQTLLNGQSARNAAPLLRDVDQLTKELRKLVARSYHDEMLQSQQP